jgi:hypothetical protein
VNPEQGADNKVILAGGFWDLPEALSGKTQSAVYAARVVCAVARHGASR